MTTQNEEVVKSLRFWYLLASPAHIWLITYSQSELFGKLTATQQKKKKEKEKKRIHTNIQLAPPQSFVLSAYAEIWGKWNASSRDQFASLNGLLI